MDIRQIVVTAVFALVGSFLGLVFARMYDYMWKPFFVDHNMNRLREAMDHLKAKHNDVEVQVSKAELELKTCTHEVRWWLDKVKSIEDEVIHIEEEIPRWRSNYLIFWKHYNVGCKVVTKRREVSKLHDQGTVFVTKDVATDLPLLVADQVLPSTPRVWGMDSDRDQIIKYINDGEVKMIGIWGMGGVGKTTLLKQINNYYAPSSSSFDHVMFVVASKDVSMERLQKKIHKSLGLSFVLDDDIDSRLLFNFLKKKKALLLLDDLWEHVDLTSLGIPLGKGKCKVVFTTQSVHVCRSMKAERELRVECLNIENAWSLFKENVGENIIKADPSINRLAKEVVEECCGLPLAIITIGRTMSSKNNWKEWQDALNLLRNSRYDEISGMPNDMFPKLEFSYRNLHSDTMRECFLTCSMWPEDCDILIFDLIECWMGLGLIDDCNEINEVYDRGYSIIESLIGACLLERAVLTHVDDIVEMFSVKMHDVLRDLALWIASDHGKNKNTWMVQAGVGLKECKVEKWKGLHRISLMSNNIESVPEDLPECPELLVLMLNDNLALQSIPQSLFHCFISLTYLNLELCHIQELPPAIGKLVNLKSLNLRHAPIQYLPDELANLVNLKYLFLRYTSLKVIPWQLISRLSMLKVLDLYGCDGAVEMESQGGFEALKQLDGRLVALCISISTVLALNQLSKFSTISIIGLEIMNLESTESMKLLSPVLFGSKVTTNSLYWLHFHDCKSLKLLIVDSLHFHGVARSRTLPRLEELYLERLTVLEKIVWRGVAPQEFLPSLRVLQINDCPKLKDVSWILQLPNLEFLGVGHCDEIEMMIGDAENDGGAFPRLRRVLLTKLGNLGSICSTTIRFPSLERIVIRKCPKLKKLPFQALNIPNKLQVIEGSTDWWENLDWADDDSTKSLLQNYFKATTAY